MSTDLSRRSFLKATGGAAAAATVAGCITGSDRRSEPEGGTLNLINATMSTLDPIASTDTASGRVVQQIYEPLTNYPNGETEIANLAAESYEISDDNLTYTFSLVDAQFHNGDDLTADDFVYAWRRLAESPHSQRANFLLGAGFLAIEHERDDEGNVVPDSIAVEAVDDSTFEVTLSEQNPYALEIMAYDSFAAIPEGYVDDLEDYDGEVSREEFATESPVGTGPFQFETWEPDAECEVTWFEDYHSDVPVVESVHWQIIEDDDAAYTYAMERSADIFGIPTAQYDPDKVDAEQDDRGRMIGTYGPVENGDTVQYHGVPQLDVYYVAFNASNVPRPVRQAIAYMIDRDEFVNGIFKGRGEPAATFTPPGIWPTGQDGYQSFVENYPYGAQETMREEAEQTLSDAGHTSDDPYQLTLTTYQSDVFQEFGRNLRDKLSGTGVELELEEAPFATLQSRGEDGSLDFYSLGWTWSWPDPGYGMFGFEPDNTDTSRMPDETNGYYLDWDDVDSDAAQKAQDAWDTIVDNPEPDAEDTRNQAYVEMEEAIREDAVCLPLMHSLEERFIYNHVDIEPFGAMGGYLQTYNEVSVDNE